MSLEGQPSPEIQAPSEEELRKQRGERLIQFLNKLGAHETFDTFEHKLAFIEQLSFEDFTHLLTHINGIVRDLSKDERQIYQPVNMAVADEGWAALTGMTPSDMPPVEDKPELLEYAFDRVKELDDPKDMAVVAAASINAVHPFGDGNGRTSRLVYDLLNYDYTGNERDQNFLSAALSNEGRSITPDVDPSYLLYGSAEDLRAKEGFTKLGEAYYYYLPFGLKSEIDERTDLEPEAQERLRFLLEKGMDSNDQYAVFLAMSRVLKQQGRIEEFVSRFVSEEEGYNRAGLDTTHIIARATAEDIYLFYEGYWQAKSDTVSNMIDLLVENSPLPNMPGLNGLPARDFARKEIAERLEKNHDRWPDLAEMWPEIPVKTEPQTAPGQA